MTAEEHCRPFGDKSGFAIELCLAANQPRDSVPLESLGTWGAWRLFVAGINLCRLQLETEAGVVEVHEVRWFLAPLIRWLIGSWMPLLHEARLPEGRGWGDRRPRWARTAYLAMLERAGDDMDSFLPWQQWGSRHALRFAAEGGFVPDVFIQRVGDEVEFSWGDRIQPGGQAATFLVQDAAMLLMPPHRIKRPTAEGSAGLRRGVSQLADRLEVSRLPSTAHGEYRRDRCLRTRSPPRCRLDHVPPHPAFL